MDRPAATRFCLSRRFACEIAAQVGGSNHYVRIAKLRAAYATINNRLWYCTYYVCLPPVFSHLFFNRRPSSISLPQKFACSRRRDCNSSPVKMQSRAFLRGRLDRKIVIRAWNTRREKMISRCELGSIRATMMRGKREEVEGRMKGKISTPQEKEQ